MGILRQMIFWSLGRGCDNEKLNESLVKKGLLILKGKQIIPVSYKRGENLGLDFRELAFYDALEINDSAVAILGDEILRTIARELLQSVRNSTTIDWTIKESVQATLRRNIRRILRKYGYPPDKQEKAIQTVIEQAKLLAEELV